MHYNDYFKLFISSWNIANRTRLVTGQRTAHTQCVHMTSNTFAAPIYQLPQYNVYYTTTPVSYTLNQSVCINKSGSSIHLVCVFVYYFLSHTHKERRQKYQSNDQFVHPSKLCVLYVYGPMRIMLVNFVFALLWRI